MSSIERSKHLLAIFAFASTTSLPLISWGFAKKLNFSNDSSPTAVEEPSTTASQAVRPSKTLRGAGQLPPESNETFAVELKENCSRHFSGLIQSEVRAACASGAGVFAKHGKELSAVNCRLDYGEDPRLVMACMIGVAIVDDLSRGQDGFKRKLQLCSELYPAHTEIDAFLQESCLTGIHLPGLVKNTASTTYITTCSRLTPERSFIGPCAVGLSLAAQDQKTKSTALGPRPFIEPSKQNRMCEQFFDHNRLHMGYRACLNASSLAALEVSQSTQAIAGCGDVVSDANSETERAACLVGLSIHRRLARNEDITARFQKCGETKVSYEDRKFLACLTAASLLDLSDKSEATKGCKEIFKNQRTPGRDSCLASLALF